ncbi:UDP-glucose 4-epimerase GalE [Methylophilus sp. VKM B-3414]|uniref:UDP-glucose 4-epimerase GalE n=1 Tax=Methylophilus sp. VKM B-3414 TaxID=3076121 RepID=UPI0028C72FCB|nr:UDP-glucose 4-epimerase GalE [Methylophilus sp. VKM B-3414]MDT7850712.1 UDP-glucose 4-epimerase GalE [Methylophilus sp. VKM B-3414]
MRVLVVGGAGYIGSHMVKMLLGAGHEVVTLDNLSSGHRDAVLGGVFVEGDLADSDCLNNVFKQYTPDAVMHFASFIQVGESVRKPDIYYRNNVTNTLNLLDAMREFEVNKFIFSSTAAVFGEPDYVPIDEAHPNRPLNPYGRSKLMIEQVLADYDKAFDLRSVCLRYFNAAGADPDGQLGERHDPETHLIPLILQAASGRRENIQVFGRDYDTPDGTCIRDYIHIVDLCSAHLAALEHLNKDGESDRFNLGNGEGFSVQEVITAVQQVSGRAITVINGPRREGDPARLVADSTRARSTLMWRPKFTDLETIVAHAWQWELKQLS